MRQDVRVAVFRTASKYPYRMCMNRDSSSVTTCLDPENGFMLLENGLMGPRTGGYRSRWSIVSRWVRDGTPGPTTNRRATEAPLLQT